MLRIGEVKKQHDKHASHPHGGSDVNIAYSPGKQVRVFQFFFDFGSEYDVPHKKLRIGPSTDDADGHRKKISLDFHRCSSVTSVDN